MMNYTRISSSCLFHSADLIWEIKQSEMFVLFEQEEEEVYSTRWRKIYFISRSHSYFCDDYCDEINPQNCDVTAREAPTWLNIHPSSHTRSLSPQCEDDRLPHHRCGSQSSFKMVNRYALRLRRLLTYDWTWIELLEEREVHNVFVRVTEKSDVEGTHRKCAKLSY